jgi:hypothetical protein
VRTEFYITAVCVNWGRKYDPGVFKRNVMRVMRHVDGLEHVVILPQELDEEPDPANEHRVFNSMLEPGTHKVFWKSREPIILSPAFKVHRRRRVLTMGSGEDIDPQLKNIGPKRYGVTCVAEYQGVYFGLGNTHPHRRMPDLPKVMRARDRGEEIFSQALRECRQSYGGIPGIWGADMNDTLVPKLVPNEKVGARRGLDHLRYWNHPKAEYRLKLVDRGSLKGTIDPHDPLWARFAVKAA